MAKVLENKITFPKITDGNRISKESLKICALQYLFDGYDIMTKTIKYQIDQNFYNSIFFELFLSMNFLIKKRNSAPFVFFH